MNRNCLRYSMNRILSKDHKIGAYDISKIFLCCFHEKIHIFNNGIDALVFGY